MEPQLKPSDIAGWLSPNKTVAPDQHMQLCASAVEALIGTLPDAPLKAPDETGHRAWTDQTKLAAIMLGARLYRRRNSANGIEAMSADGASYVSRYDSDISRLLRIDGNTRPRVG